MDNSITQSADAIRVPPQNIEAEKSVLGSLMLDKDAVLKIADNLNSGDFYRGAHQIIYEAMIELYEAREPIDLLSLSNKLEEKKQLENVGGVTYLTTLVNTVPTASHVTHYADIVKKKRVLRSLISASDEIARLSYDEKNDLEEILNNAEKSIFNISQKSTKQLFLPMKSALEEAFGRIDRLHKGEGALRGLSTGFKDLDNYLGGLQKSDLVILAARPSLGKTSLALNIAANVAIKEKVPIGIFSLEMSNDQMVDRLIATQAGIDLYKLRTGKLSSDGENNDFFRIQEAMGVLSEAPIFIDDASSSNIMQMRTMARKLQMEHGLGLIVIDYLQLMQGTGRSDSRVEVVSEISRALKMLARELNIPILALSQLSRATESRPDQIPRLSDLRESGSIEQDADTVLFIYREDRVKKETERKNIADIIIAKHRNGPCGKVDLYFHENQVSFKNLEKYHT
jgi:replicative DNA helicase